VTDHSDELPLDGFLRVNALLLPVATTPLLVPMSAIAEIVSDDISITPFEAKDERFYGWIRWRNQTLPLLSFEGLSGTTQLPFTAASHIVILNAIGDASKSSFYGLVLQGFPRRIDIANSGGTRPIEKQKDVPGVLYNAELGAELVRIPDFEFLEMLIAEAPAPNDD